MKPPAFQFYADDFLAGTADMTQPEVGAYILLLCHQWGRGEIPADPARAALIAKGEVPAHVIAKFPNGKNERLERVRENQEQWREKSARAGKKSADLRNQTPTNTSTKPQPNLNQQGNQTSTKPQPTPQPKPNSPTPTPTPTPTPSLTPTASPSQSAAPSGADAVEAAKRPRDFIFEALAVADNAVIAQLTPGGRGAINKARMDITRASPDVTPEEIARRFAILTKLYPTATMGASALAKNWAKCASLPVNPNSYAASAKRQQDEDRAEAEAKAAREASAESSLFLNESLPAWASQENQK
jgi:uncharacterized protein YdaU (DUF1376 family)